MGQWQFTPKLPYLKNGKVTNWISCKMFFYIFSLYIKVDNELLDEYENQSVNSEAPKSDKKCSIKIARNNISIKFTSNLSPCSTISILRIHSASCFFRLQMFSEISMIWYSESCYQHVLSGYMIHTQINKPKSQQNKPANAIY